MGELWYWPILFREIAREAVSAQETADIVFGAECPPCQAEEPCACGPHVCRCACGRCQWPYPLPDDGRMP